MARSIFDRAVYTTTLTHYKNLIYSYDMQQAGLSVLREKKILSKEEGERYAALPKHERVVAIGKLCQSSQEITQELEEGLKDAVFDFCRVNDIGEDDLISIKKDAIYCIKAATTLRMGDYVQWIEQTKYHCFYSFRGVEVYFSNTENILDIKGITDDGRKLHSLHFSPLLAQMLRNAIATNRQAQMLFFKNLRRDYLSLSLHQECYREFTRDSKYKLNQTLAGMSLYSDFYVPDSVDISYNYQHVMVPIISSIIT